MFLIQEIPSCLDHFFVVSAGFRLMQIEIHIAFLGDIKTVAMDALIGILIPM